MDLNPALIKHKYARPFIYTLLALMLAGYFFRHPGYATTNNGFNLSNSLVPAEQIFHGGPPKDGIPAIDNPEFITVRQAGFLKPEDRVLGATYNGISRAYPVRILNYHEIVNDEFQGQAVVITYCPLCGTGMAFDADVSGHHLLGRDRFLRLACSDRNIEIRRDSGYCRGDKKYQSPSPDRPGGKVLLGTGLCYLYYCDDLGAAWIMSL